VPALAPNSFSIREKVRLRGNVDPANTNPPPTANTPTQPINIAVIALPRVSNHDDLDPFRRAGCRIRVVTNPAELAPAHIIIIPGSKSTMADLRWMKSRGLDTAIIEAATKRDVTVVGICGGYQILGKQLDDPEATESPEPQSETGLGLLPTSNTFDTTKTTRRVNIEIPAHSSGPIKGPPATGTGYEIHTGITTGASSNLSTLEDTDYRVPSEVIEAEGPGQRRIHARPSANARTEQTEGTRSTILRAKGRRHGLGQRRLPRATESSDDDRSQNEKRATSRPTTTEPNETATRDQVVRRGPEPNATPDGTISPTPPVIGTYVHGLFDSPEILRRLLNTTGETHNLPEPLIAEFSMDAEYDRLAQVVRESIDMSLINSLIR